jgi:hypothetical protein
MALIVWAAFTLNIPSGVNTIFPDQRNLGLPILGGSLPQDCHPTFKKDMGCTQQRKQQLYVFAANEKSFTPPTFTDQ